MPPLDSIRSPSDAPERRVLTVEQTCEAKPARYAESKPHDPRPKSRNKAAYTCTGCGLNLWGKPNAPAACWACRQPMPRTK